MDENYHVSFYDQYGYVVQTLQTDTYVEVVDAYLICGSNGDSIRFFANTVELIEGPTFSQAYTPLPGGFFQQGSQYFERLSTMYDYIKTNVVNVVVRDISALKFRDGTTQTTAATGGEGSGTVTQVATTGPITGGPITTTGTIGITQATSTTNGYLSSTDWNAFDNKFDNPTGNTSQYLRGDGSLATFPSIPTVTPAALTKTNDTNVTLTLGGSPTNALLQAVSMTLGWTGTLADSRIASASTWNSKEPGITPGNTGQYWRGDKSWQTLDKSAVGLGNVDNTSDANKPISTATQTALNAKQDTLSGTGVVKSTGGTISYISGTSSEYIKGDGTLGTFPTTGGGIPHGNATASVPDTYTTTITGVTAYNDADAYLIRFATGNTTSATLNINSIGAIPLYRNNDGELIGGDIIDGAEMLCIYNSTTNRFQVIGTAPNTLLSYVTNDDTVAIVKGQPVYAFGGTGDRLTVKRASNSADATSAQTVGLVLSTSIGVNQKGLIILNGQLDGLGILKPSAGWLDGDAVYLGDTPGSITRVKPYAPKHLVYLGFVTSTSPGSAGRMYVRVQNGYEMDELHNVQAQNPNLNDTLYYDNTVTPGQWKTASISTILGYTPGQGTVTSVSALALGTSGTDLGSSVATGTTTPVITLNVPTASATNRGALSSTDWSTFNGKQDAITGAATTITTSNLTASRALISDGSGKVATNAVTSTELGYLSGVTSSIQTQLNTKISTSKSFMNAIINSSVLASTTTYGTFGVPSFLTTEALRLFVVPQASTFSRLYIKITSNQVAGGSLVFTIRKNSIDTAIVATIAAGSAGGTEVSNTANSVSFAAGDDLSIKIQNNAAATSATVGNISIMVEI